MDKTPVLGLPHDNGSVPNDSTSAPSKGKRGRKGSQSTESKSYPLRSAHSSARVLRSTSKTESKTPNEPVSPLRSAHSSARVLRSTPEKKRKTPKKPVKSLKSARSGARALRSTSKKNSKAPNEPVNDNTAVQPTAKKRKRGRPSSAESPKNENQCIKIRQRVRYVLNRMNYEQSLIQAYASEGWKGQSSEKIRPEKELERAKAEILRCKLRIREAFRNMDSLLSEGKIDESLFDSDGEISSEDIFCAICGSKHVTLKNDIILCDGACDRGFHQKCLNPPLLAEDIPPEDEGWLCPACNCKLDCIDVLNELQGSTLDIHDSWEKVFPESASLANGAKQIGSADLPSDDSEDNDYDPTLAEGNMVDENKSSAEDGDEGSDSDDLDFMTSSDDSEPSTKKSSKSKKKTTVDDLGLPSEDSEDDDFDPEGPDSSEDQKTKTNSEESDFTSDSDDFCAEISKSCGKDEVLAPPFSDQTDGVEIMEAELEQDLVLPASSRRQVGRLDYKTLYDEAYGKETSDPSDEEEWSGKENLEDSDSDSLDGSHRPAKTCSSKRARGRQRNVEHTPRSEERTEVLHSNGSSSMGRKGHGPIVRQKLKAHIEKDPYPSRSTKESLAQELGLTLHQVTKWFASTRHYSRVVASKKEKHPENHTAENNDRMAEDRQVEPNGRVLKDPTVDGNGNVSEDRMVQDNLREGKKEDASFRQDISFAQMVVTPTVNQNRTTNSREVGSPNRVPRGDQYNGNSRNAENTPSRQDVGLNQTVPLTPSVNQKFTPDTSSVGSPGVSVGKKRRGRPRKVGSPRGRSAEKSIPGLEHVDEARRKAILRELRKMKTGR